MQISNYEHYTKASTTEDLKEEVHSQKAVITRRFVIVRTVVIQVFSRTAKLLRELIIYKLWITRNIIYLKKERQTK